MKLPLKDLLRSTGQNLIGKTGRANVVVDLTTPAAEPECLRRLEGLGLSIRSVTHNKVIGSIAAEQLPALRGDSEVREVEESTQVKPH